MRFYHSRCIGELPVVGGDNAAFAGRHVLRRVKAEAARIERSYLFTLVYRAVCLAGVLDDREPVIARDVHDGPHVGRVAIQVYGNDGLSILGYFLLYVLGIYVEGLRLDVGENRFCASEQYAVRGRDKGERRGDDLIALADTLRQ